MKENENSYKKNKKITNIYLLLYIRKIRPGGLFWSSNLIDGQTFFYLAKWPFAIVSRFGQSMKIGGLRYGYPVIDDG